MPDTTPDPLPEAHPVHVEYVIERAIGDDRWVVDSIGPEPTPEQALAEAAWFMDDHPHHTYRTVRRTTTSAVVAVHQPTSEEPRP
ncbi:hypothetical protein ABZX65_26985 [Streptomyces sp. NPDC003300]|uniref:hypothetical protein n=1 Tax=unclassified Streptomyces TaxID=2593676 RepID=UPI0033A7A6D0